MAEKVNTVLASSHATSKLQLNYVELFFLVGIGKEEKEKVKQQKCFYVLNLHSIAKPQGAKYYSFSMSGSTTNGHNYVSV